MTGFSDAAKAVIVGAGHTPFGRLADQSFEELVISAARDALDDAGIDGSAVGGVWLGHFNSGMVPDGFCSSMIFGADEAMRYVPATRCENACASGAAALYSAIDAIEAGRVDIALVVGAEKMTHLTTREATVALGGASYQKEEAGLSFPAIFARYAQSYTDKYGDISEALAHIAVKNHHNALSNPLAHMRKALDYDFCLHESDRNPMVAPPLKVTDCSLISDGAAAVVLARADRVSDFSYGVAFRAREQVSDLLPLSRKDLVAFEGPRRAFQQAYDAAGVTVDDLDFAEVHDCFTIAELLTMEAMGLALQGEASSLVREGQTVRGGRLPINLSGGLKAKGHPVGATGVSMHVLATRQLTGRAGGDLQLPDASLGLCFNMGGGAVTSCVSILEPIKA